MKVWTAGKRTVQVWWEKANRATVSGVCRLRGKLADTRGQGTTEYAILVGVLVVIAIIAIAAFKPKIQELWDAIKSNLQKL